MDAATQTPDAQKLEFELSKICIKLEFIANALVHEDHPAGEILSGITKELDPILDQAIMLQSN
jgi:hypothetical protein